MSTLEVNLIFCLASSLGAWFLTYSYLAWHRDALQEELHKEKEITIEDDVRNIMRVAHLMGVEIESITLSHCQYKDIYNKHGIFQPMSNVMLLETDYGLVELKEAKETRPIVQIRRKKK